jgi:hypothetical protein
MNDWLYEGEHGFTPGHSCESQVIAVFQDIVYHLEERACIDVIIIEFFKAFDLLPRHRLLTKLTAPCVDSRVVV